MKTLRRSVLLSSALLIGLLSTTAQEPQNGRLSLDAQRRPQIRTQLIVPDVNGNQVLKCDFHMHTVFSDGHVWPTIRLREVWQEGLDAMSLTEHREYSPFQADVKCDKNRPYEIIKNEAARKNTISILGGEVTRETPPGHFNAIFLQDAQALVESKDSDQDYNAIKAAHDQGAFIFWNHPGWKPNIQGSYEWIDFVDKIYKEGMLHGIEVINGFGIHLKALDWCVDHNLTVMGTSDIHQTVQLDYNTDLPYVHRTMTLVFAKERTPEAIHDALKKGQTVAWAGKYLAGKEENVRDLFNACVEVKPAHHSETNKKGVTTNYYEISNNSSLYFELILKEGKGTRKVVLYPQTTQVMTAQSGQNSVTYECVNTYVRSDKHLSVVLPLR